MCGIVGWPWSSPAPPVGSSVLARMRETTGRFFERFLASRAAVVGMLDRHREGRADFALYVWTIYNAVAWFDYWIDKSREVRVA